MAAPNRPTTIKTKEGPPLVVAPVEELVTNAAAVAAAFDAALSTFGSFVFNLQHGGLHVTSLLHHKKKKRLEGDGKTNIKILRVASTRQPILHLYIQHRRTFVIGTHGKDNIHPFQIPTWERERTGSWWRLQSELSVTTNLWIWYTEGDTPYKYNHNITIGIWHDTIK